MSTSAPRTLGDQLRSWSAEQLEQLLLARADLVTPAPADSTQLASRAVDQSSVLRALDSLNRLQLEVLRASCQAGGLDHVNASADAIERARTDLQALALIWGSPAHPVSAVRTHLGAPDGPPNPDLSGISRAQQQLLVHLSKGLGVGSLRARTGPAAELLEAGLLQRKDERHVVLPWSVRLALYDGKSTTEALDTPGTVAASDAERMLLDSAATGSAIEFCQRTEVLLEAWATRPPVALKSGGLGLRERRSTAELLGISEAETILLIEVAQAAGLLGQGLTEEADAAWLPTPNFDSWLDKGVAERWAALARAWLKSDRLLALAREGEKPAGVLTQELSRSWLAGLRAAALGALPPYGQKLAGGTGLPSLVAVLAWQHPLRPTSRFEHLPDLLAEATSLGIVALDGISALGTALLGAADADDLSQHFPAPIDHVLLQADLTAVAPGPLTPELARDLALMADIESRGGAGVYRFSAKSIRRAFDRGWSAEQVHAFVNQISRTPAPQSLSYLIDDVSRRFGVLRAGMAESFLRSDDEAALHSLMQHADKLELRLLAPTVLISALPISLLLPRVRELGMAPVLEAPDGTISVARPQVFRAPAPKRGASSQDRLELQIVAAIRGIQSGDRVAPAPSRSEEALNPAEVIALLRSAIESGRELTIDYLDNDGTATRRQVRPRHVEGGRVQAYDIRSDFDREFAVHRITNAQLAPITTKARRPNE